MKDSTARKVSERLFKLGEENKKLQEENKKLRSVLTLCSKQLAACAKYIYGDDVPMYIKLANDEASKLLKVTK